MAKAAAGAEANILRMAPTAQRFPYLPISTPASAAAGMRRLPGSFPASPKHGGVPALLVHVTAACVLPAAQTEIEQSTSY